MALQIIFTQSKICLFCLGTGWASYVKKSAVTNIKPIKPSIFDLDKCTKCNGTGEINEPV